MCFFCSMNGLAVPVFAEISMLCLSNALFNNLFIFGFALTKQMKIPLTNHHHVIYTLVFHRSLIKELVEQVIFLGTLALNSPERPYCSFG